MRYYKHHIIPFHEWKDRVNPNTTRWDKEFNAPDNVVFLTLEQHIEAHGFLYELNGSEFDRLAIQCLSGNIKNEEANRLAAIYAHTGEIRSTETKQKISKALKGNKNSLGYKHTEEWKQAHSKLLKGRQQTSWLLSAKERERLRELDSQ